MKNIFFICVFSLIAFTGCTDDENILGAEEGGNIESLPNNKPNDVLLSLIHI